ncbi:MAG: ABC transporter permease subunit [Desulfobacterales bacterium]|nr:ABC transporter permease subunit [Desulfobacterales bacterium]
MRFILNRMNSMTIKRINRFKEIRRAYYSLWFLLALFVISLFSELVCNNMPLFVRYNDKSFFPVVKFYPEDVFLQNGRNTRPDYKKINESPAFMENKGNFMLFPPFPYGPYESIDPSSIDLSDVVTAVLSPLPVIGNVNIKPDGTIVRHVSFDAVVDSSTDQITGSTLDSFVNLPDSIIDAIRLRFDNRDAPKIQEKETLLKGKKVLISLSAFKKRSTNPDTVRLTFRFEEEQIEPMKIMFNPEAEIIKKKTTPSAVTVWTKLPFEDKNEIRDHVLSRFMGPVDSISQRIDGKRYRVLFEKKDVRFPFEPVGKHILGIDSAGRDVMARILYGLRTSLSFGILLVVCSMVLGIFTGAIQGYYGGVTDITAQRLIEIWSAIPFLYVMILIGSVYGRHFFILMLCYGLFNWIGISYYTRAEFLRLRKQPFVEAAKCMGVSSSRIIFKHIMPNAMVPVITFFPFSLVGAIGSLAALDYLGFGLPPPTPSWGELLFQAQQYRWAWWLILYPSMALFLVMLLGVFVGEGIRNAYDPKRYTRLD